MTQRKVEPEELRHMARHVWPLVGTMQRPDDTNIDWYLEMAANEIERLRVLVGELEHESEIDKLVW